MKRSKRGEGRFASWHVIYSLGIGLLLAVGLLAGCDTVDPVGPDPAATSSAYALQPPAEVNVNAGREVERALPSGARPGCAEPVPQANGSLYQICWPDAWNGELVVYAHGYVAPQIETPVITPETQELADLVLPLGFAFATTSYPDNGLVIKEGVNDVEALVRYFTQQYGPAYHVYLTGASEGGLIATLAVEQKPDVFDGGFATCGPYGNFRKQLNWFGNIRVVFDYFFPRVLPRWTAENPRIPDAVIRDWETAYVPAILQALRAHPNKTRQFLDVTKLPVDRSDPAAVGEGVISALWYNVFATNDATDKLGGQPFDNTRRFYFGSSNDFRLNRRIERFEADRSALEEVGAFYQTAGDLEVPLVTMHTTGDPVVPIWHQALYRLKTFKGGTSRLHNGLPILRYEHCNFEDSELLAGFALLVYRVRGRALTDVAPALSTRAEQNNFRQLAGEYGAL